MVENRNKKIKTVRLYQYGKMIAPSFIYYFLAGGADAPPKAFALVSTVTPS